MAFGAVIFNALVVLLIRNEVKHDSADNPDQPFSF